MLPLPFFILLTFLSCSKPVFIAPAMDLDMYNNSSNKQNIKKLTENGNNVLPVFAVHVFLNLLIQRVNETTSAPDRPRLVSCEAS